MCLHKSRWHQSDLWRLEIKWSLTVIGLQVPHCPAAPVKTSRDESAQHSPPTLECQTYYTTSGNFSDCSLGL